MPATLHRALKSELATALDRYQALTDAAADLGRRISSAQHLVEQTEWYHGEAEPRPDDIYPYGPIRGTKAQLSLWIYGSRDPRRIERANRLGAVWTVRVSRRAFDVWFMSRSVFTEVLAKRLAAIAKNRGKP